MQKNERSEISHGIMFHHFHSSKHNKSQGSISKKDLEDIIDYLSKSFNILNAEDYTRKAYHKILNTNDICLTFDDALLCQYDIALPVLEKKGIQAYFFVYTSIFSDKPDNLEIFRYFRNNYYNKIDDFYENFFNLFYKENPHLFKKSLQFVKKSKYLESFKFYSFNDRFYRYLRDNVLKKELFENYMFKLITQKNTRIEEITPQLWINKKQLLNIKNKNHSIGLHSHNHPTMIHRYSYNRQKKEYDTNYSYILKNLSYEPISVSHPCGNYNEITLDILKNKGIKIGFRSNMDKLDNITNLEIPREDHINILKEIK